ncbi:PREDICTED: uncharacterized protein LOC104819571 [Tarenaya hassleriana]|uniref:uncharacterized protein LOC104819571 n=1 Tax=Tarenaya hassleriana TaxID=28532 RepID=UPI00053C42FC|nr:PREDICTED: uncharacterized protein LOC104819571 [Tarenaya hassleriana]XP_010548005.1 PREDICTED: uncharacterized protein LOC104819571 [Tarenaya hassleriana]XP_010548006.1 PREDICTED: uncharacterized protein LOC104819571 [Tarenaya hassleriana]XP_010548007.1 PREDICTED: uncharacterized protein LOC104819571 [Tarenaya hassleriana]
MSNPDAESSAKTDAVQPNSASLQNRCSAGGPVAILWDMENCPVPSGVRPEDVAGNIRMALRLHPAINGAVVAFSAYGDFNSFPRRVREGCQRTGVKLVDVPNGRKDAADKAILVDMFLFALDNRPPSSIVLISGDVDFAPALHILGQRGYNVILVVPSGVVVNSALCNAGRFVWNWQSIVRGEGFVPQSRLSDMAKHLIGREDNPNGMNGEEEEEAILYRGISRNCYNPRDSSTVLQSLTEHTTALTCHPTAFPSSYDELDPAMWVAAPGDVNGLKGQLVRLLELSDGCMSLLRVPSVYQKHFGKPLYVSEYGALKLVDLFKKMGDAIAVDGKGNKRFVYLRNWKANPSTPLLEEDKKGKDESLDDDGGAAIRGGSSAKLSDVDRNLEEFRHELQQILVSYSCRITVGSFEEKYRQRYKKPLDYRKLGVDHLEKLLDKVRDVVIIYKDPATEQKFIEPLY